MNPNFFEREQCAVCNPRHEKADATFNSFGFKFASLDLNCIGSIRNLVYEGGKINIRGVPFSEVVGQAQKRPVKT